MTTGLTCFLQFFCRTCCWNDDCEFTSIDDFPDQSQVSNQGQVIDHQVGRVTRQSTTANASNTFKFFDLKQICFYTNLLGFVLITKGVLDCEISLDKVGILIRY